MRRRELLGLLMAGQSMAKGAEARPLQILIVDGISNHDGPKTTRFLKGLFEAQGHAVDISTTPAQMGVAAWDAWRPAFSEYSVVVQTVNNIQQPEYRWPRRVERDLEAYLRGGGGMIAFHSANNAFPHWEEYNRMIGVGWRPAEYGTALEMDAQGNILRIPPGQGEKTSHGPRQDTLVHHLNPGHAINRGLPERWMTPDIEVYRFARGPAQDLEVLSYGRHKATDTWWPLEWAVRYGRGRVYSSSFGHIWKTDDGVPDRVRCAGFQTKLLRAAAWVANAPVPEHKPGDFPSESDFSIRPA